MSWSAFQTHSFLYSPHKIRVNHLYDGICSFEIQTRTLITTNDLVVKWAEDKSCKTIYRITEIERHGDYHYYGTMRDLYYYNEVTKGVEESVRKIDSTITSKSGSWQGIT